MLSYLAYGLGVHSELPIPEFTATEVPCDVSIGLDRNGKITNYVPVQVAEQTVAVKLDQEEAVVYHKNIGVYLVQRGCRIIVIPRPDITADRISHFLVGMVIPVLLYQRGLLILHASAISIDGHAIVFLGHSGEGKSTMAAALHARGHSLIADDIVAVTLRGNQASLSPGFSQLKLTPDTAEILGYDRNKLVVLNAQPGKRAYRPKQVFSRQSLPVRQIYILVSGSELSVHSLKPHEAVVQLIRYAGLTGLLPPRDKKNFLQCTALVKACPIYQLQRPRNLTFLSKLARLVEESMNYDIHPSESVNNTLAS